MLIAIPFPYTANLQCLAELYNELPGRERQQIIIEAGKAGWRMASPAMRLAILAACAVTFSVLIDGRHFAPPAALIIFRHAGLRSPCASQPCEDF